MRRAGAATLARIAALLEALRRHPALREGQAGHFFLGACEVLHFHDDPAGVFADLRLAGGFVRLPATSPAEQAEVLGRLEECLDVVEARGAERGAGRRRRHD
jgi:hypothetical protein